MECFGPRCKVFMPLPSPLVSENLELKPPKEQNQILSSILRTQLTALTLPVPRACTLKSVLLVHTGHMFVFYRRNLVSAECAVSCVRVNRNRR